MRKYDVKRHGTPEPAFLKQTVSRKKPETIKPQKKHPTKINPTPQILMKEAKQDKQTKEDLYFSCFKYISQ